MHRPEKDDGTAAPRPYHHGDLKAALLAEAEKILERDGMPGLTLRAIARAAGVSHTAAQNHFGDLIGLRTELAASGFRRYTALARERMELAGSDPKDRLRAMARALVAFSRQHPGLSTLMFRSDTLDRWRPSFRDAVRQSRQTLHDAGIAVATRPQSPVELLVADVARSSLVQGFVALLLAGRLDGAIEQMPGEASVETLLERVLDVVEGNG